MKITAQAVRCESAEGKKPDFDPTGRLSFPASSQTDGVLFQLAEALE
jgi:hypothetical protein